MGDYPTTKKFLKLLDSMNFSKIDGDIMTNQALIPAHPIYTIERRYKMENFGGNYGVRLCFLIRRDKGEHFMRYSDTKDDEHLMVKWWMTQAAAIANVKSDNKHNKLDHFKQFINDSMSVR
jgi:hypothetical protein